MAPRDIHFGDFYHVLDCGDRSDAFMDRKGVDIFLFRSRTVGRIHQMFGWRSILGHGTLDLANGVMAVVADRGVLRLCSLVWCQTQGAFHPE